MAAVQFDLQQWSAWAPGRLTNAEASPVPPLEFLPAMQRRRLSALARVCFHVCWQVIPPEQPCGLVFCSRHGETQRTLDMLNAINLQEPVSPTAFSHSVHNAIPALLSIARHDITEQVTIAQQGQDGLGAAFLEAGLMLASGSVSQVVVICCDEPLPALFKPYAPDSADYPWATAFRLGAGSQWTLSCDTPPALPDPRPYLPAPLQLIDALDQAQSEFWLHDDATSWIWRRQHA